MLAILIFCIFMPYALGNPNGSESTADARRFMYIGHSNAAAIHKVPLPILAKPETIADLKALYSIYRPTLAPIPQDRDKYLVRVEAKERGEAKSAQDREKHVVREETREKEEVKGVQEIDKHLLKEDGREKEEQKVSMERSGGKEDSENKEDVTKKLLYLLQKYLAPQNSADETDTQISTRREILASTTKPVLTTIREVTSTTRTPVTTTVAQIATTETGPNDRRMMEWFKKLFKLQRTPTSTERATTTKVYDHLKVIPIRTHEFEVNNQINNNISTILNKLVEVLEKINHNLEQTVKVNKTEAMLLVKVPLTDRNEELDRIVDTKLKKQNRHERFRREVKDSGEDEVAGTKNNDDESAPSRSHDSDSKTSDQTTASYKNYNKVSETTKNAEKDENDNKINKISKDHVINIKMNPHNEMGDNNVIHDNKANNKKADNEKDDIESSDENNVKADTNDHKSVKKQDDLNTDDVNIDHKNLLNVSDIKNANNISRRFNNEYDDRESVKYKLLAYISHKFEELKEKMAPLIKYKETYGDDRDFKIGYIIANLDTLELNLESLRDDMKANKYVWDDMKVLDLFEKIDTSTHVTGKLMDALKALSEAVPIDARSLPPNAGLDYFNL